MSIFEPPLPDADGRITVRNVNAPDHVTRLNGAMYMAMYEAMVEVLPTASPGLTQAEISEAVIPFLPEDLYPGGAKASWWAKSVQLDLEARGMLTREKTKPLRWYQNH